MTCDQPLQLDLSPTSWYDLWHVHPDMEQAGNASPKARAVSLRRLVRTYDVIAKQVRGWITPHQSWILVDPTDSGQYAVYLHTPNPNKDNFPYGFEGVLWGGSRLPQWVRQAFPPSRFKLGRSRHKGWTMYWAIPR